MRQILSRSVLTVAAASSILAATGGYATADSDAQGVAAGSPGVLSGNSVSAPIDVPVNACGNTVDAVGVDNPAFGNTCANVSHSDSHHASGANAQHIAKGSPGVAAGNSVDIPVHAPVNACGNTADAAALLNPVLGNTCVNGGTAPGAETPHVLGGPVVPGAPGSPDFPGAAGSPDAPAQGPAHIPPQQRGEPSAPQVSAMSSGLADTGLADTGLAGGELGAAGAVSAALLLGGAILYRRAPRPARARGAHARH